MQAGAEIELAKQIPAVIAIIIIVAMFIKYLGYRSVQAEKRDETMMAFIAKQNERFETLGETCHQVQETATRAIHENTKMIGRVEKVIEEAVDKLQTIGIERRRSEGGT